MKPGIVADPVYDIDVPYQIELVGSGTLVSRDIDPVALEVRDFVERIEFALWEVVPVDTDSAPRRLYSVQRWLRGRWEDIVVVESLLSPCNVAKETLAVHTAQERAYAISGNGPADTTSTAS